MKVRARAARGSVVALVFLALGTSVSGPAAAREIYGLSESDLGLYMGNAFLSSWRVPEARRVVDTLLARNPRDEEAKALEAHVLFFEGAYPESLARKGESGIEGTFRDLVRATAEATRDFAHRNSEHFRISWENPKD